MLKPTLATLLLTFCALFVTLHTGVAHGQVNAARENAAASAAKPLPLTSPLASTYNQTAQAWSIIHERARIEADGRLIRTEFNKWIGHSPARPNLNASYLSNNSRLYYIPARGQFVNAGLNRSWYW